MRAYYLYPCFDIFSDRDRTSQATRVIVDLVFDALRRGGDNFQGNVQWADPGHQPSGVWHEDIGVPHLTALHEEAALRAWLARSADPFSSFYGTVRSLATCRCATFVSDGGVYLGLRHEDPPPVSSHLALVRIDDVSDMLAETDIFDGFARVS